MTHESSGRAGTEGRARLKELAELLKAFDERPGDPDLAAKLLARPLERRAYEGLDQDSDAALVEMALSAGKAARVLGKSEEAIRWYSSALEPCERAAAAAKEGSPERAKARARVVRILCGMVGSGLDLSDLSPRYREEAPVYLEHAAAIAEDLFAKDAAHSGLLATVRYLLGFAYNESQRQEEARPLFERAAQALASMVERGETRPPFSADPRLLLVMCLLALDRTDEAEVVFERALLEERQGADEGRFDARAFAGSAFRAAIQLGQRDLGADVARWADRATSIIEAMPSPAPSDVEILVHAYIFSGHARFAAAEANAAAAGGEGGPAEIDPAEIDAAIARFQRAVDLATSIEGMGSYVPPVFVEAAMSIGEMHAKADRPEQALEAYERADALMERLGVTREMLPALSVHQEGLHRSECLQAVGREAEAVRWIEQALRAIDQCEEGELAREEARAHLGAALLSIAELTGVEAQLDAAGFVAGSAHLAITYSSEDRLEKAALWLERSEAAREEASLPVLVDRAKFAYAASRVGSFWKDHGRHEEAILIWSRAAVIFDQLSELDRFCRAEHGVILFKLAWDYFESAWDLVKAALGEEPPDLARVSELMAEPLRLFHRSCEVLAAGPDALPSNASMWASNQSTMGLCHKLSGRSEEALQCYERILEGRAELDPGTLADAWQSRAQCLHELGRRAEALTSLQRAEQIAAESGDPELLEKVRAAMAEAESGPTEGAPG